MLQIVVSMRVQSVFASKSILQYLKKKRVREFRRYMGQPFSSN